MTRVRPASYLAAALVACLCSCGVPLTDRAEPVQGFRPTQSASSARPSSSVGPTEALWFVDGDGLRRLASPALGSVSPAQAVEQLTVPPPVSGLRTLVGDPQSDTPLASVIDDPATGSVDPGTVVVRLSDTFTRLAPADQVLMIGQVVLTVTETVRAPVGFVDANNAPVTVPLPDGRLQDAPVVRDDYLVLAQRPPSPSPSR